MSTAVIAVVLIVAGLAAISLAAPLDSRFTARHDKDNPWPFTADFADRAAWERRAAELRTQVMVSQGLWPMPPRTPLDAVIHGAIDRDDYTIEKVFFQSVPGHTVCGNLYRPKHATGKLPVVLCPYGHWPGGRFIWRSDEEARKQIDSGAETDPAAARSPLQANCAMLARMGCVVFHYDMAGYCDSNQFEHGSGFADREAVMRCQSFMGLQTWNSIRAVDFVLSLPEVDASRLAVAGSSGGGTQAILLSIADPRVAVSFPMVMVSMNMQGGCMCENAPLLRVRTNNVELASLLAPRPQGMAAANDWTVDFERRGLPEMKRVYRLFDAENRVEGRHFDFGHNHNLHSRELQYNFLNRHLRLGWPEPVREAPFEPVPPEQLSVFDAAHSRPADKPPAELRRWLTATSDRQLAELQRDPAEYRRTLRAALSAMIVDDLPPPAEVELIEGSVEGFPRGGGEWSAVVSRRGMGERIAIRAIVPADWNGAITLWAHPEGRASLDGHPAAKRLVDSGSAVLAPDTFASGPFVAPAGAAPKPKSRVEPRHSYLGYSLGYERCVIAERAGDLLSVIALARRIPGCNRLNLIAHDAAGTHALIARALAGDAIARAAIDLGAFDFDQIAEENDARILPGALKYGGISAIASLCDGMPTLLCNLSKSSKTDRLRGMKALELREDRLPALELADWLISK